MDCTTGSWAAATAGISEVTSATESSERDHMRASVPVDDYSAKASAFSAFLRTCVLPGRLSDAGSGAAAA